MKYSRELKNKFGPMARLGVAAALVASLAITGGALAHSKKSKSSVKKHAGSMMKKTKDTMMKDSDAMMKNGKDTMMKGAMMEGAGVMSASAEGVAIWQFPDKKKLDPALFGTPSAPINVDLLPIANRATNDDGSAYTTIKKPSMFSNKIKMTTGKFTMQVKDVTPKDSRSSGDQIAMDASFVAPNGKTIRVTMKKVIPVGPDHPFFGGVGTNVLMHGATGIGTPLVAQEFSYITAWGLGDIYVDGKKVDSMRVVHIMVSERTRDDKFMVGFGVAKPDELEIHLAMPPMKGSPKGPVPSPVPTGVTLPNGMVQPFIHVNFYGKAKLEGNQFYASN